MATVKFLYRSTRDIAPITLRLSFRIELKDHVLESKTQITCGKEDWKLMQNSRRIKDAKLKNKKNKFDNDTIDLESHVLQPLTIVIRAQLTKFGFRISSIHITVKMKPN